MGIAIHNFYATRSCKYQHKHRFGTTLAALPSAFSSSCLSHLLLNTSTYVRLVYSGWAHVV